MDPQQEKTQPKDEPVQPSQPTLVQTPLDTPAPTPEQPIQDQPRKAHKTLGLILLIGPSVLLFLAVLLYALSNLITASQPTATEDLFPQPTPLSTIINILLFLMGAIGVIAWLPGIIVGIILLNNK
jgi:hypothetical protein